MSLKRPSSSSSLIQTISKTTVPPSVTSRKDPHAEIGDFEDEWDDEFADEDIIEGSDKEDDEENGVAVDDAEDGQMSKIREDTDAMNIDDDRPQTLTHLPHHKQPESHPDLKPDLSAYPLLHSMSLKWPALSFDILRDPKGEERRKFPQECCVVAGTQAAPGPGGASQDEVVVMKWEGLSRTDKRASSDSGSEESDDDDSGSEAEDDPVLTFRSIPHRGCVNRIRAQALPPPLSNPPPTPPSSYFVSTFSETGKVHIFDVAPHLHSLNFPQDPNGVAPGNLSKQPSFTIDSHKRAEGYALAWGPPIGSNTGARLLSGDIHSNIYLTTLTPNSFNPSPQPFTSHTSSVEDIQWSPAEPTVFSSCSADRSLKVWDIRVKNRKSVISVDGAHDSDVNVLSWNTHSSYLIGTGGDEGGIKIWDLRNFKSGSSSAPSPVASFSWHKAPITSIEWHPTEDSCFAASGADDQVTLWDLAVEVDEEERPGGGDGLEGVPPQLLFIHQGQKDVKELHWHPQIPGVVISTALDGFNIFKTISV